MRMNYDGNRLPEESASPAGGEFPGRGDEFARSAREFSGSGHEFSDDPGEISELGKEGSEPEEEGRERRRQENRKKKERARHGREIRKMCYCVAAAVTIVSTGWTIDPEWDLGSGSGVVTDGEVVENNSVSCVTSSLTGAGIPAKIVVRKGSGNGRKVKTVSCDADGNYELTLSEGSYVLEISANGYMKEYFELEIYGKDVPVDNRYSLSPELGEGQFRIVLEWGEIPSDLDSHLEGETDDGTAVHVSYSEKIAEGENGVIAILDRDDTDYYGPETTTIYIGDGVYTFRVHDYSNGWNSESWDLANSGATVKVYRYGGGQPRTYTVPAGSGCWWHVFDIDHGVIRDVNTRE